MEKVTSHRDLIVWQRAMHMAVAVYSLSSTFPRREMYGLTSQITRSAASVAANIAEGNARGSTLDYAHFVAVARGSLMETETYIALAARLGYASAPEVCQVQSLIVEIDRMLCSLRRRLLARASHTTAR